MADMTDWDWQILEEIAGKRPPSPWGAAIGAAIGFLRRNGYINQNQSLTAKGQEALAERERQG